MPYNLYVTGFEKTRLPHTQYHTSRNDNALSYSTSKVMSLVFVAAYLRPYVSLEWCFGATGWSQLSCIGDKRAGKPQCAGQCLSSSVWNAVSTRKVYLDLLLSIVFVIHLYSYIEPTLHPLPTILRAISLPSQKMQLEFWGV